MARKKTKGGNNKVHAANVVNANMVETDLEETLKNSLKIYGTYVLEERAIPALQDGLKPVQRRLLWAAYSSLGSRPDKNFIKSARVSGQTMQFHPHGEAYLTAVNMTVGTPLPLFEGHGNFGGVSDPPAAPRYTEMRIGKFADACLFDRRYATSYPKIPNFDGSALEPAYLPAQLPLVLALGTQGIGLGTTTHLPSYSADSLYQAVWKTMINAAKLREASLKKGKKFKGALPSKGYTLNPKTLHSILKLVSAYDGVMSSSTQDTMDLIKTGKASILWECLHTVDQKSRTLTISGVGPNWPFDARLNKIRSLQGVASVHDLTSGENGLSVRVEFKKMSQIDFDKAIVAVRKQLESKVNYRCNIVTRELVTTDELPDIRSKFASLSVQGILAEWCVFRVNTEATRLMEERKVVAHEIDRLSLMLLAANNIDTIFKLLKAKGIDKVKELSKRLKITEEQSLEIWAVAVGKLDRLSKSDLEDKLANLEKRKKSLIKLSKTPEKSVLLAMKDSAKVLRESGSKPIIV